MNVRIMVLYFGIFYLFSFSFVSAECEAQNFFDPIAKELIGKQYFRTLLIIGCARSGTTYMTQVLRANGLDVKHEGDGSFGIVSWPMVAESETSPWGPGAKKFFFSHIFHQVRDPLKTIASASKEPMSSWVYICRHCPEIKLDDTPLVKAAKYWYYWNLLAEKKAEWTYRVEDIEAVMDKMGRRLKIKLDKGVLVSIPKNTNSRNYRVSYTWPDIKAAVSPDLYKKIVKLAKHYGYKVNEYPKGRE